ncbi:riboflavin synthase [bacterium]|nr:riboflavin synthase [bacterium]
MFTGLIEEVGHVVSTTRRGNGADITIEAHTVLDDISIGDSISVSGACLTVTTVGDGSFTAQAVEETLRRTTIGGLSRGAPVNLERALRLGDRLGGHLVQGHVDGTGRITAVSRTGDNMNLAFAAGPDIERYIVEKGSITVDGISLTVTFVRNGEFGVSVIPHTLAETTLCRARVGSMVNLETDILAKYVEKLIHGKDVLTIEKLEKLGF